MNKIINCFSKHQEQVKEWKKAFLTKSWFVLNPDYLLCGFLMLKRTECSQLLSLMRTGDTALSTAGWSYQYQGIILYPRFYSNSSAVHHQLWKLKFHLVTNKKDTYIKKKNLKYLLKNYIFKIQHPYLHISQLFSYLNHEFQKKYFCRLQRKGVRMYLCKGEINIRLSTKLSTLTDKSDQILYQDILRPSLLSRWSHSSSGKFMFIFCLLFLFINYIIKLIQKIA